jgi:2-keto-4-pentenoate hydratase
MIPPRAVREYLPDDDPIKVAAARLLDDWRFKRMVAPLPEDLAPVTENQGYAIQFALCRLAGANPPGGFKIGATAPAMRDYLGVPGPLAGFMRKQDLLAENAVLKRAEYREVGVECEVAVRLGRDMPWRLDWTAAQAQACIAQMFAAIEIVENRYGDFKALGAPTIVAERVFHAGAVLGRPSAGWQAFGAEDLRGWIEVDGAIAGRGNSADLLGGPFHALAWLASSECAYVYDGLRAGQVVMLGSICPPVWIDRPCRVRACFDRLMPVTATFT